MHYGFDINTQDLKHGYTPLIFAVKLNEYQFFKMICNSQECDLDMQDVTYLFFSRKNFIKLCLKFPKGKK